MRLTVLLCILSILSYSTVWAMHSHDDIHHTETAITHSIDSHVSDAGHTLDDDHCCHASVHLLGLLNTGFNTLPPIIHTADADYHFYLFSYHNGPPRRPPLL